MLQTYNAHLHTQASVPALLEASTPATNPNSAAVLNGLDVLLQVLMAVPGFKDPPLAELVGGCEGWELKQHQLLCICAVL